MTEKPKILIVDDQPRNLDVLEVMLGDMDCTLVRATSADDAELHGGTISAFSDGEGTGAKFVVRLPGGEKGTGAAASAVIT
jgi:hypothetical protein